MAATANVSMISRQTADQAVLNETRCSGVWFADAGPSRLSKR